MSDPARCGLCGAPGTVRRVGVYRGFRLPQWSGNVRGKQFPSTDDRPCYDKKQVAAFLDAAGIRLAAMESTDRPAGPLVSGAILVGWAEWADSTTFSTRRLREGYDSGRSTSSAASFATRSSGSGDPL
jgi:hypothetical protein